MNLRTLALGVFTLLPLTLGRGVDSTSSLREPLKTVTAQYLIIEDALASDKFDGVTPAALALQKAVDSDPQKTLGKDFDKATLDAIVKAPDLHAARLAFRALSDSMIAALAHQQAQTGQLHAAFCPMIKANWVQTDNAKIHNPYYGAAMSDCGEFRARY